MNNYLKNISPLALAFIAVAVWGFNFVAAKIALENFSPFFMLSLRFLIVFLLLIIFYPKPPISTGKLLVISFTFGFCHLGSMFMSLYMGLSSSVGIVVDQVGVPFTIILAFIFFQEKPSKLEIMGIFLALIGTFFLAKTPNSIGNPIAFFLMILAGFFWAVYSVELKKFNSESALALVTWISLYSFFITISLSLVFEDNHLEQLKLAEVDHILSLFYTATFASIVAHGLWGYLMTSQDINKVIPMILLVPLFGVYGGVVCLNEEISLEMALGTLMMLIGLKVSLIKKL